MTISQLIQTKKDGIYNFCKSANIDDAHAVALVMIMESTALETAKLVVEKYETELREILGTCKGQIPRKKIRDVLSTARAMGITE